MIRAIAFAGILASLAAQGQDGEAPSENLKKRRAAVTPGKPVDSGEQLKVQTDVVDGLTVTRLGLAGGAIETAPIWSPDGKTLFVLEAKGTLRRIQAPSFQEERRVDLNAPAAGLCRSREGLLVLVASLEEVWVIDEVRLSVKSRLHAPRITSLSSAPSLSAAFGSAPGELRILDLKKGGWTARLEASRKWLEWRDRVKRAPTAMELMEFANATVSPDGRHLYWVSLRSHWRGVLKGATVEALEAGPSFGGDSISFGAAFSPESRLVAFTYYGGNQEVERWPKGGVQGFYVFKVDDLQQPVGIIGRGAHVTALAFDKAAERVYTRGLNHKLAIWTSSGIKTHEFPGTGLSKGFLLAHPEGRRLLVQSGPDISWIEIPENLPSNVGPADTAGAGGGKPVDGSSSASGGRREVEGLVLTEVQVSPPDKGRSVRVRSRLWAADGRAVYIADTAGQLVKLSVPDLKEVRRILIGDQLRIAGLSREGLLVPKAGQELWVLDPASLEVKSKIPVPRIQGAATTPTSSIAICNDNLDFPFVDLKKGMITGRVTGGLDHWKNPDAATYRHPKAVRLNSLANIVFTPDGKKALVLGEGLHRFAADSPQFPYEEAGPPLQVRWLIFSQDSRYVAACVSPGQQIAGIPTLKDESICIFKVNYLAEPVMILEPGVRSISGFGFDALRKKLYLVDHESVLTRFDANGERDREFAPWKSGQAHATLGALDVSPTGDRALFENNRGLFLLELPK